MQITMQITITNRQLINNLLFAVFGILAFRFCLYVFNRAIARSHLNALAIDIIYQNVEMAPHPPSIRTWKAFMCRRWWHRLQHCVCYDVGKVSFQEIKKSTGKHVNDKHVDQEVSMTIVMFLIALVFNFQYAFAFFSWLNFSSCKV